MIARRTLAHGAALLWLLPRRSARAQAATRLPRVAFITTAAPLADMQGADPVDHITRGFVHGLRDLGWTDGRNVAIEHRSVDGRAERLPALLRALIELPVDGMVTAGGDMALAARRATGTIPIVAIGPDHVGLGLAASLARPGGNVTGLSFTADAGLAGKRLELLRQAVPAARRIAVLRRRPMPGQPLSPPAIAAAVRALGLELSVVGIDGPEDLDPAFAEMSRHRPDAIWCTDGPVNVGLKDRITALAARHRLPAVYGLRQFAAAGGLMSYGVDLADVARNAARYVDRILKGAKPGEMAIEQPTRFEFVINLKAAAALGLTIPAALLQLADEVIR